MSNDQLHNTAGANLSVSDVSLDVAGVAAPALPTSLTLTGSGFGAVTNPRPTAYDTFEDYQGVVSGSVLPSPPENPNWGVTKPSQYFSEFEFDSSITFGSRLFSIKNTTGGGKAALGKPIRRVDSPEPDVNIAYFSWYTRFNERLGIPYQPSDGSNKLARIWDNSGGDVTRVSYISPAQGYQTKSVFMSPDPDDSVFRDSPEVWHRCEILIDSTGDKTHDLWVDGKHQGRMTGFGHDESATSSDKWYASMIGYDIRNTAASETPDVNSTLFFNIAEFYQAPTAARVELSNDAIYTDSSYQKRVVQRVISRTDTEIIIPDVFYGELDTSRNIYAHILKSDGSAIDYGEVS